MSQILKGLLEPKIKQVLAGFGTDVYSGPDTGGAAEDQFAAALATAIAQAVQQYLVTNVMTVPGYGPVGHVHKILAP